MAVDTWRHVSRKDLADWRSKVKDDLRTKRGTRYEYNTARTKGLDLVGTNDDGSATVSSKSAVGIRSHRETTEIVAQEMAAWIKESRGSFMGRIRMLKQMGNFQHLTDEDAASRMWELCQKVAQSDVKRVYRRDGYDDRYHKGDLSGNPG